MMVLAIEKVAVIGLGYVGMPEAVHFATSGYNVIGVDIDSEKVRRISDASYETDEPQIKSLLRRAVKNRRFSATTDGLGAVKQVQAVLIAVPTPVRYGVPDLRYLKSALSSIAKALHKGQIVVIESTVPPGTTGGLAKSLLEEGSGLRVEHDFYLSYVPERIAPGRAMKELASVPRLIGGVGPQSTKHTADLYRKANPHLNETNSTTAELSKLAENGFRDLNIAYANLLALVSELSGADVHQVIDMANTHPRVGIHRPGPGVGGPCLTKDPYMLLVKGVPSSARRFVRTARLINDTMPGHMAHMVLAALEDSKVDARTAKVTVLGTAYKGGIDDTRSSPAEGLIEALLSKVGRVTAFDPYTTEGFGAVVAADIESAATGTDAIVIVTDHPEFRDLNLRGLRSVVRTPIIVDGRHIVNQDVAKSAGFLYRAIGLGGNSA